MKNLIRICIQFVLLAFAGPIYSENDLIDVKVPELSDKSTLSRQELIEKAIDDTSSQYIQDLIGVQKYDRNRSLIKNKIIKHTGKYVLYQKQNGTNTEIKISAKNLNAMLQDEGLFYKTDGPPRVLPFVTFTDRSLGSSWSWWVGLDESKNSMQDLEKGFHEALKKSLRDVGFFGLNPSRAGYSDLVGGHFHVEALPVDDFLLMGEFFQASIVVRGAMTLSLVKDRSQVYRMDWKLSGLHSGNGRVIGEVVRSFETESGPETLVVARKFQETLPSVCTDLASQLVEAWRSGTFGASLLKLTVRGDLEYPQIVQFKKVVAEQIKEIKLLRERNLSPGQITFELDSSVGSDQLAQILESKNFQQFKVKLDSKSVDSLVLHALRLNHEGVSHP